MLGMLRWQQTPKPEVTKNAQKWAGYQNNVWKNWAYSQTGYGSQKTKVSESNSLWHSVNKLFIDYPPGPGRMDLVIALPFQLFVLSLSLLNFNWLYGMFWDFHLHAATWGLISTDGVRGVRGREISQARILPGWAESNSCLWVPFCSAQLCCTPAEQQTSKCFCSYFSYVFVKLEDS